MKTMLAFLALLALTAASPAFAEQPTLKPVVTVSSDVVRIGDLIENAGPNADVAVFRSPDLGRVRIRRAS